MRPILFLCLLLASCAGEPRYDPRSDYEEVDATTVIDAPGAKPGRYAPAERDAVARGEYLVELLGCGSCHTDGALAGEPDMVRPLAGSRIGIAWTSPLDVRYPGVVYPANITPDIETGIGAWSDPQIANAIRAGIGRHGDRRIATMPWQGYATLTDDDVRAIVSYLRSVDPVTHRVPDEALPGSRAREPFVYFGVYRSR
ncbi:MAG: c-type cytochrome [Woeseiaceae bacterium]|nr:c-type cytochrome [Woeseiaceae bacterium]